MSGRLTFLLATLIVGLIGCSSDRVGSVENRGEGKDQWWDELPRASWLRFEPVEQSLDWFEVYRVAERTFAIYEPGQFEEVISYLILGDDRGILFDTGLGIGDMRLLVSELTRLPVSVVNSHTHYDHIGGNHQFDAIYGVDSDYTRERARGLPHEDVAEFVGPGWIWKKTPRGFKRGTYETKAFEITQAIDDDTYINLGNRLLDVILTPGHAPDALCLFDRANGLMFTGDTFYLAPLYTHLPGGDFGQYRASAKRLRVFAPLVKALLPGHNETMVDGRYLTELDAAFEAVASGEFPYRETDGNREYGFGEFSIITSGE